MYGIKHMVMLGECMGVGVSDCPFTSPFLYDEMQMSMLEHTKNIKLFLIKINIVNLLHIDAI